MTIWDLTGCMVQLICLGSCAVWAVYIIMHFDSASLFRYLFGGFGCYFMGTMFWLLYFKIIGIWPTGFSASDMAFFGFYFFLLASELKLSSLQKNRKHRVKALIAPVIVILLHTVYFLTAGGLVGNILYCIPLSILCYVSFRLFLCTRGQPGRVFYGAVLVVISLELTVFLVSSFGWNTAYFLISLLESFSFFLFIPAAKHQIEVHT